MSQREIYVKCLAKTVVDKVAVMEWLERLGEENRSADSHAEQFSLPDPDIVSDPALLIALAGKRCYMSFEEGLNPNVNKIRRGYTDYFDNILASGHGCYDGETEVLTAQGWKAWPDVTMNDELATRAGHDDEIEYHRPRRLIAYEHSGRMYRVEAQGVDLLVTPDHNMLACVTTTREGRKRENFSLIKASDLDNKSHAYVKTGEWRGGSDSYALDGVSYTLTPDVMALLGFAIGDGNLQPGSRRLTFHLRRAHKIAWLRAVASRLTAEWGNLAESVDADRYWLTVPDEYIGLFHAMYADDGEKRVPSGVLTACTRARLVHLFDGLMQSDGSKGATGDSFDTTSPYLPGQFQQLCLHIGLAANIVYVYGPEQRPSSFGDKPLTRLSVIRRALKPEVNKFVGMTGRSYWIEGWAGTVYCAEVPNNTLYVRRNGVPVWSGNSVLEHSVFTYAMENVTRVFSAELNRHRAGWAISEGSLRFIRFDRDIPFWMPLSFRESPTDDADMLERKAASRQIFIDAFHQQESSYAKLLKIWDMDATHHNFGYKKVVTSALRRIVGLGVSTGGVWTGNVRALRHVLTMRCSPAAEEEICHVFSMIVADMARSQPLLFGDFAQGEDGFWRPKYVKV